MNTMVSGERLAYSINEASRATSLGRTRLYQLIADGRLQVVKIGNRTLIPAPALHKLLEGDRLSAIAVPCDPAGSISSGSIVAP